MVSMKLLCAVALFTSVFAAQNPNANGGSNAVAGANQGKANANNDKANNGDSKAAAAGDKSQGQGQGQDQAKKGQDSQAQNEGAQNSQGQGQQDQAKNDKNSQTQNGGAQNDQAKGAGSQAAANQAQSNQGQSDQADNAGQQDAADSTVLAANAIQTGSFTDGQQAVGAEDGQAVSQTSQNNFMNACSGSTLTNGLQIVDGSCNGIIMGALPAKNKMVSCIILFPQEGQAIPAGRDFNISLQVNNIQAGSFTNAIATYYAAPQTLNDEGIIIGHTHVTVQDLGNSLNPQTPPDPTQFAFFKGINDAGNGNGLLQAVVAGGLPEGNFRVCTLSGASNHQPVIMPVAQRGSQDDCTKFTVSASAGRV